MKVERFPRPYYASFLLRDTECFSVWASSGSIYRKRSDRKRHVYCDIRVGTHRYDQVSHGGLLDNDDELFSNSFVRVPIDDRSYDALRLRLWHLTESKFREALADFNRKDAEQLTTVDPNRSCISFCKLPQFSSLRYDVADKVDEEKWIKFCKQASQWMAELPQVSSSWLEFDTSQETKLFVSSERRIIVQHVKIFSLIATFNKLTSEGVNLIQEVVFNCASLDELPDMRRFKEIAIEKHARLVKLARAKKIHAFSGPVMLYPQPAGLLFHEAIGHRLEGNRLLSSGEGQTFKGQVNKKILNVEMTIRDNPLLQKFDGRRCVGSYLYDDEGAPAKDTLLVEDGVLRTFLSSRAAFIGKKFEPNGHARNARNQRPMSRMAVTIVESQGGVSHERMKELLLREIRRQKKPFGMIVYETSGGETETTNYDFQAFSGQISYATLIYADGKEECVRGVDFVGTPLQALANIIAIGDSPEMDNGFCGAESGMIPVTTISPAVLLSSLELQAKEEELVTQYILPRPRRSIRPLRRRQRRRRKVR